MTIQAVEGAAPVQAEEQMNRAALWLVASTVLRYGGGHMKKPTKLPATATTPMLDGAAAKALAAEGDALRRAMRKRIRKMWTISDEERQVRCQ